MAILERLDISTSLKEGLSQGTMESRRLSEVMLEEMFEKYGVPEEQQRKLVKSLRAYAEGIYGDVYDMAIQAGAELGDIRGYKMAMDEAEDVAAQMIATTLMKR